MSRLGINKDLANEISTLLNDIVKSGKCSELQNTYTTDELDSSDIGAVKMFYSKSGHKDLGMQISPWVLLTSSNNIVSLGDDTCDILGHASVRLDKDTRDKLNNLRKRVRKIYFRDKASQFSWRARIGM